MARRSTVPCTLKRKPSKGCLYWATRRRLGGSPWWTSTSLSSKRRRTTGLANRPVVAPWSPKTRMLLSESLERVLVVAPHADDEVLGCGGLLAKLAERDCDVHVLYMAVDGSHHYGLEHQTTYEERVQEIAAVTKLLGCGYDIAYGNRDMMEKLDTLPKRELVDLFQGTLNEHRPDLLLLPYAGDYDQ